MHKSIIIGLSTSLLMAATTSSMAAQTVKQITFINKTPVNFVCTNYTEKFLGTKAKLSLAPHHQGTIANIGKHESWTCQPLTSRGYLKYGIKTQYFNKQQGKLSVAIVPLT